MSSVNFDIHPMFINMRIVAIRKHINANDYIKSTKLLQITLKDIVSVGVVGVSDERIAKIIEYIKTGLVMLLMHFDKLALIQLRNVSAEFTMDNAMRRWMVVNKNGRDLGDLDTLPLDIREMIAEMVV